jgi:cytochrome c556
MACLWLKTNFSKELDVTSVARLFAASMVFAAGVSFAHADATDPNVIARQDLMKVIGGSTKTLGDMAGGKAAYDAAAAETAKAAMIAASADIEAKFMTQTTDPEQEAKPEVWTNWDDFLVKAKALNDAATALDTSSAETIGAGMGAIGGSCKSCHTDYRM